MQKDVIIALDFPNQETTLQFLDQFKGRQLFVKVGMELFYSSGPEIIKEIKARGHKIFLDLKLHDIPNTVEKSMKVLANLGVDICNLHAGGTKKMMQAALKGLTEGCSGQRPLLIAVTQLTSTNSNELKNELLIDTDMEQTVLAYAKNAKAAGLDGVVCSPLESQIIHKVCGEDFVTVTPGIRFTDSAKDDQTRITTPLKANQLGSNYIVVGRPITAADNPISAYERCVKGFVYGEE